MAKADKLNVVVPKDSTDKRDDNSVVAKTLGNVQSTLERILTELTIAREERKNRRTSTTTSSVSKNNTTTNAKASAPTKHNTSSNSTRSTSGSSTNSTMDKAVSNINKDVKSGMAGMENHLLTMLSGGILNPLVIEAFGLRKTFNSAVTGTLSFAKDKLFGSDDSDANDKSASTNKASEKTEKIPGVVKDSNSGDSEDSKYTLASNAIVNAERSPEDNRNKQGAEKDNAKKTSSAVDNSERDGLLSGIRNIFSEFFSKKGEDKEKEKTKEKSNGLMDLLLVGGTALLAGGLLKGLGIDVGKIGEYIYGIIEKGGSKVLQWIFDVDESKADAMSKLITPAVTFGMIGRKAGNTMLGIGIGLCWGAFQVMKDEWSKTIDATKAGEAAEPTEFQLGPIKISATKAAGLIGGAVLGYKFGGPLGLLIGAVLGLAGATVADMYLNSQNDKAVGQKAIAERGDAKINEERMKKKIELKQRIANGDESAEDELEELEEAEEKLWKNTGAIEKAIRGNEDKIVDENGYLNYHLAEKAGVDSELTLFLKHMDQLGVKVKPDEVALWMSRYGDLFEKNEHWYGDGDLNKQDIAEFTAKYKNEIQASKNPRPNNSSSDGKASSKTVDNYDNSKSIAIDTANNESITKAEMDKQNSDADNKELVRAIKGVEKNTAENNEIVKNKEVARVEEKRKAVPKSEASK